MMRIIKISTDLEMQVFEYPEGDLSAQMQALQDLVGNGCDYVERVRPRRLYTMLGVPRVVTTNPGECATMIVDEDGLLRNLPVNAVGSWLYETDRHGSPIVGNIVIVGEIYVGTGIKFCGISDDLFERLYPKLQQIIEKVREMA